MGKMSKLQNKISGIYKITNNITGDFYIGSSKDIKRRWREHKLSSRWARCPNSRLYKNMAQYGLDNFTFEIIEETDNLKEREQYWIGQSYPAYNNYSAIGINIDRFKSTAKKCVKEWKEIHKIEYSAKNKAYYSRLCIYKGETLTLSALIHRFRKQRTANSTSEAKKYLLEK